MKLITGLLLLVTLALVAFVPEQNEAFIAPDHETEPVGKAEGVAAAQIGEYLLKGSVEGASPVIGISNDGTYVAVVYYKDDGNGGVHLKSATESGGWLTTTYLGDGQNPSLFFSPTVANRVFVVWQTDESQAIRIARCTLSAATSPACDINTAIISAGAVETPDIVVQNDGGVDVVHVAWAQGTNTIRTARSANGGQTWNVFSVDPNLQTASTNEFFRTPVLALTGSGLHLAFRFASRTSATESPLGKAIRYYRSTDRVNHDWGDNQIFATTDSPNNLVDNLYEDLANPTMAVSGETIYLAWDGRVADAANSNQYDADNRFGLMRAKFDGTWSTPPAHIPSNDFDAISNDSGLDPNPAKYSLTTSESDQEIALRPSMTISGTRPAIVWQARPKNVDGCNLDFNTSAIHLAYMLPDNSWAESLLTDDTEKYAIDPDIVVDNSNNRQHLVFMRDDDATDTQCDGDQYQLYYQGPSAFLKGDNDGGEDIDDPDNPNNPNNPNNCPPSCQVYLPLISKS